MASLLLLRASGAAAPAAAAGAAGGTLPVFARLPGGAVVCVDLPAGASVSDFRTAVAAAGGPPFHSQRLSFAGRGLCDAAESLAAAGVCAEAVVAVASAPRDPREGAAAAAFRAGQRVVAHGLERERARNGTHAVVTGAAVEARDGAWRVPVRFGDAVAARLRPANLRDAAEWAAEQQQRALQEFLTLNPAASCAACGPGLPCAACRLAGPPPPWPPSADDLRQAVRVPTELASMLHCDVDVARDIARLGRPLRVATGTVVVCRGYGRWRDVAASGRPLDPDNAHSVGWLDDELTNISKELPRGTDLADVLLLHGGGPGPDPTVKYCTECGSMFDANDGHGYALTQCTCNPGGVQATLVHGLPRLWNHAEFERGTLLFLRHRDSSFQGFGVAPRASAP